MVTFAHGMQRKLHKQIIRREKDKWEVSRYEWNIGAVTFQVPKKTLSSAMILCLPCAAHVRNH